MPAFIKCHYWHRLWLSNRSLEWDPLMGAVTAYYTPAICSPKPHPAKEILATLKAFVERGRIKWRLPSVILGFGNQILWYLLRTRFSDTTKSRKCHKSRSVLNISVTAKYQKLWTFVLCCTLALREEYQSKCIELPWYNTPHYSMKFMDADRIPISDAVLLFDAPSVDGDLVISQLNRSSHGVLYWITWILLYCTCSFVLPISYCASSTVLNCIYTFVLHVLFCTTCTLLYYMYSPVLYMLFYTECIFCST